VGRSIADLRIEFPKPSARSDWIFSKQVDTSKVVRFEFVPSRPGCNTSHSSMKKAKNLNLAHLVILSPSNLMRKCVLDEGPLGI
jgi:hypothetical protein